MARELIEFTFDVQGLVGELSRTNSSPIPKTPRIEGVNLKYSVYKSIPKPNS